MQEALAGVVLSSTVWAVSGRGSDWAHTAHIMLRHCEHTPAGRITVTFPDWWGPAKTELATTFSCSNLRR